MAVIICYVLLFYCKCLYHGSGIVAITCDSDLRLIRDISVIAVCNSIIPACYKHSISVCHLKTCKCYLTSSICHTALDSCDHCILYVSSCNSKYLYNRSCVIALTCNDHPSLSCHICIVSVTYHIISASFQNCCTVCYNWFRHNRIACICLTVYIRNACKRNISR